MRPTRFLPLAAATLVMAASGSLRAQPAPFSASQLTRLDSLFAPYAHPDRPGCAVGIADGAAPSFVRGYGAANVEHGIQIGTSTPFNLGSVAKQFTAMAALLLDQAGRLSLDDPVSRYVPGVPAASGTIRVRDLLDHTSGLRDLDGIGQLSGEQPRRMTQFLSQLRRQRATQFPVGARQEYTHSDYTLLSEVIAVAAGMSYARFLDSAIFTPFGMRHAGVYDFERRPITGRAEGYRVEDDVVRLAPLSSELVGNSNIFVSVEDMLRWGANVRTGTVGGRPLVDRLFAAPVTTASRPMAYRHGLWHDTHRGEPIIVRKGHGGSHSSAFLQMPGRDLTVAVLCNRADVDMMPLLLATADVRLDDLPPVARDPRGDSIAPPPGESAQLAGIYAVEHAPWTPMRIEADGDRLVDAFAGERFPLTRLRDGRWHADGFTYDFERDRDGVATRLVLSGPDVHEVGVRLAPSALWRPSRATLASLAGRYESEEAMAAWTIAVVGDSLVLERLGQPATTLRPVVRDVFAATAYTASGYPTEIGLEIDRDARGRATGFRASALPAPFEAARGLRFERLR